MAIEEVMNPAKHTKLSTVARLTALYVRLILLMPDIYAKLTDSLAHSRKIHVRQTIYVLQTSNIL